MLWKHQEDISDQGVLIPDPLVRLWLLRIIVPLGGHRDFLDGRGFSHDVLAHAFGISQYVESNDKTAALTHLRHLHQQAEQQADTLMLPLLLQENLRRLSSVVELSNRDTAILAFTVMLQSERLLDDAADWLGNLSSVKLFRSLSIILDLPESDVRQALAVDGVLARSGLVTVDCNNGNRMTAKLLLLSDHFADRMLSYESQPMDLLRGRVASVAPGYLGLSDYAHIEVHLKLLLPYLRQALASRRCGVNVFVHGRPGTGKSQLVRTLAAELRADLFEVCNEDADTKPIKGEGRLRALQVAQGFLALTPALLAFDEVEDVFNDGGRGFMAQKSTAEMRKAWMNRMLEENPVPTVWLSNTLDGLDPAFIRRFDMIFELPVPPKKQRQHIVRQTCQGLVNEDTVARIAEVPYLAPAIVAKAASVVASVAEQLSPLERQQALERLVDDTLQAQGHPPMPTKDDPGRLPAVYDASFVTADTDLEALAEGLQKSRAGRLCLYGPPGTGKTAYGRWLAERLDMPLLVKRVSDVVSPYLGETEQNMAKAFREASREKALLLMDEVDSFLQDRRRAQRSWEVSQVNEMLTQMEAFDGIFLASTNLMEGLDEASLRRFDIKIRFGYLRSEQARALCERYRCHLGLAPAEATDWQLLQNLGQLTPGDFATVARQHRFRPLRNLRQMIEALQTECRLKTGSGSRIGFV